MKNFIKQVVVLIVSFIIVVTIGAGIVSLSDSLTTNPRHTVVHGIEILSQDNRGVIYYRDMVTDTIFVIRTNGTRFEAKDPDTKGPLTYERYLELYKGE